jgi:uncharacterized protein YbgA (DUF1722 family)/uncharacterized protein YbbK (DUF523 family)
MENSAFEMSEKPRLAVSSCLLGEKVRFDGGHKYDDFINRQLARFFDFAPICPEVGIGLGTPRPPIRLVRVNGEIRAQGVKDPALDATAKLNAYLDQVRGIVDGVCGYILKKGSPSCGMERVKVYAPAGMPAPGGSGLYAARLMREYPCLPVEEEGRLHDPHLRENFITRVLVYRRWQELLRIGPTPARLVAFHTRHKLLVMAHGQAAYRRLGRLVAQADALDGPAYFRELMAALARRATNKSHANVLQHLMGYLKKHLDGADKAELLETIEAYRRAELPLVVPLTLLNHHFRRHPHAYVADQVYLSPHPAELMLRNAI